MIVPFPKTLLFYLIFLLIIFSCRESSNNIYISSNFSEGVTFSAIVIGDWGIKGDTQQINVSKSLSFLSSDFKPNCIISTGDNFYESGVSSVSDEHWKKSFEDVYSDPSLFIPWYIVFGNHDYRGNPDAEIAYTSLSTRWNLPARTYDWHTKINDSINAHFIFIDSSPLTGDGIASVLAAKQKNSKPAIQYHWLDSALTNSQDKWKIIVGHHPIYSGGLHGNNSLLIKNLLPLFKKYHVNLYIAGHDHDLQYLEKNSIAYVISGSGGKLRPTKSIAETQYAASIPGTVYLQIADKILQLQYYSDKNELLFQKTISANY